MIRILRMVTNRNTLCLFLFACPAQAQAQGSDGLATAGFNALRGQGAGFTLVLLR